MPGKCPKTIFTILNVVQKKIEAIQEYKLQNNNNNRNGILSYYSIEKRKKTFVKHFNNNYNYKQKQWN